MASVYDFKRAFQRVLRPLAGRLIKRGVSANQITIAGLVDAALAGLATYSASTYFLPTALLLLVPVFLLIRMALNALDGMVARQTETSTPRGMILNEVTDVIGDWACYLPIGFFFPDDTVPWVGFVLVATLTELVGITALAAGGERAYQGPMGKSDRALLISVGMILYVLGWHTALEAALWVGIALGVVTVFNRALTVRSV